MDETPYGKDLLAGHEGSLGSTLKFLIDSIGKNTPLSHMLPPSERPFHRCSFSELAQFRGGLVTAAVVGKRCLITEDLLPCKLEG